MYLCVIFAINLTGTSLKKVKINLFQFREMILCAIDHWASLPHKKNCDTKVSGYVWTGPDTCCILITCR